MYRPTNCRPGFYMSATIDQRGPVTIDTNNNGLTPVNVFIVIIPFRPAHILTRLW